MRNLKRALSLALASVMLLGMMVVGSSAAFADDAEIVNKEAVEITAGLGLFAGSDGKFNPTGTVTRAQMAAVIAKMFYGSDLNADTYKGGNQFTDTADFEGGWAEGYINLGVEKGWFKGYGDGTFGPGNAVTTAEAVTMLINLLKVDAGEGTWPMTVMAAAEEIDLFDLDIELKPAPATNVALTRDQLAVMVWNALNYSPEGKNVYMVGDKKFDTAADAYYYAENNKVGGVAAKIDVLPAEDALVTATFGLKTATDFITDNQATGADCTVIGTGVDAIEVDLKTGLDMIGHYVTVYYAEEYATEKEPGIAYCIFDEGKYVVVDDPAVDTAKEYKAFFGKAVAIADEGTASTNGNYVVDLTDDLSGLTYTAGSEAEAGTYIIYENAIIGFIAAPTATANRVNNVVTTAGKESITLQHGGKIDNNAADELDFIVEYEGVAKGDYVISYVVDRAQDITTIVKADVVSGKVSEVGTTDEESPRDVITIDGKQYVDGEYIAPTGLANNAALINFDNTYDVYVDANGEYIGWAATTSAANLSEVVYVKTTYTVTAKDNYGNDITSTYVQGVDMEGKEVSILVAIDADVDELDVTLAQGYEDEILAGDNYFDNTAETGFFTFANSKDRDAAKAGVKVGLAIETVYDPDMPTIYSGVLAADGDDTTFDLTNKTTSVEATIDDGNSGTTTEVAFTNANTKFIVVKGADKEALEIAVVTGTIKKNLADDAAMILSKDANGNAVVEVVVIKDASLNVASDNIVYVSEAQLAAYKTVGNGKTKYSVYFAANGEVKDVVATGFSAAGFYEYTYDAVDDIYTMSELSGDNLLTDVAFENIYGESLVSSEFAEKALPAGKAYVIDVRAAADVKNAEINYTIESLQEMADLNEDFDFTMDLILDEDLENVIGVFITDAVCGTCSNATCTCP